MGIQIRTSRKYLGTDEHEGFEFRFNAVENSLTIKKTKAGYTARYLVQDEDARSPDEDGDDSLFLVGYHRDFTVDRSQPEYQTVRIFKKEEFKANNGYKGRVYADGYGWKSYSEAKKEKLLDKEIKKRTGRSVGGISRELAQAIAEDDKENEEAQEYIKKYHIFGLEAYIHSGVVLALSREGNFVDRQWDVSQLGLVFASKKEWRSRKKAAEAARGLIETWNAGLSGDVYGIVREDYNKKKERIDGDECWGFYGYEYALKALKTDI